MHIIYFFSYVNFNISKAKNEIERMMAVGLTTGIYNLKKIINNYYPNFIKKLSIKYLILQDLKFV